ncbi:MAG TPA: SprT family zinc-dependent metalloprotease [Marinagarivorans sp.]
MIAKQQLCNTLWHLPLQFKESKRRKTLGLKVSPGSIVVSYPPAARQQEVVAWVNEKSNWILKHYRQTAPIETQPKRFSRRDTLLFDGVDQPLSDWVAQHMDVRCDFFAHSFTEQRRRLLEYFAHCAERDFASRVEHWQRQLSLYGTSIKCRPYKSRWGSCTHTGALAFNTLLMMAPPWVRDYVVIHELCHLKHLNHSKFFWAEVYRARSPMQVTQAKAWLRSNGDLLLSLYR